MAKAYKAFWSEAAEGDLKSIIEYIYADNPQAARDSLKKIKAKVSALCSFPPRGRVVPELKEHGLLQYRELIVPPWRIIYRISGKQVYVLSVIDSRRNIEDILLGRGQKKIMLTITFSGPAKLRAFLRESLSLHFRTKRRSASRAADVGR